MNKLTPEDITWNFISSMGMVNEHHSLLRNEEYKIQKEVITKKKSDTSFGSCKKYYFIDDCNREFLTLEDLCDVWNELKNYDDPNNEIVWEKRIVPVIKLKPNAIKKV